MRGFRVEFSPEAAEHVAAIDGWWRTNRTRTPRLFARELESALRRLRSAPASGRPYREAAWAELRFVLLSRTRYRVYYSVGEPKGTVRVLAVWHTSRGGDPVL